MILLMNIAQMSFNYKEDKYMSSWYAAYYGSGLKLNEQEYISFFNTYLEINNLTESDIVKKYAEENNLEYSENEVDYMIDDAIRECGFLKSKAIKLDKISKNPEHFFIVAITTEDCDGMRFIPYYRNGKANRFCILSEYGEKSLNPNYMEEDIRGEDSYVAFSDHSFDDVNAFSRMPYSSYEEFVQEFKDKFEKYLPEDFDWEKHLGRFNYACYA